MHVDSRVFLSRPQDLPSLEAELLSPAMQKEALGADKITILSAYYGTEYLKRFFDLLPKGRRRACALELVFGIETLARLPYAVEELRKFRADLIGMGFRAPSVRLLSKRAPFHSKLYYFKKMTQPVWFIGSANASPAIDGARHELMLRLSGRHDQLSDYVDNVIEESIPVEDVKPSSLVVSDLRSFLLNGVLCYKPLSRMNFTFEACKIGKDHRAVLKRSLAEASEVPHADPQTEGFGFSLVDAVGKIAGQKFSNIEDVDTDSSQAINRLKFRHLAVETIYGYWLPSAYANMIRVKLRDVEERSMAAMNVFASKLREASWGKLEGELDSHIEGLKKFFAAHSVVINAKPDCKLRFSEFINARRAWLDDAPRLQRMVRRLHLEAMPDIWSDDDVAQKFETSFFDDLAMRLHERRKSGVISILKKEIDSAGTPRSLDLRAALEKRLKKGFGDSVWWSEQDRDEDD